MDHLCADANTGQAGMPLLLHGPAGVGKSYGLALLLRRMGVSLHVLDDTTPPARMHQRIRTLWVRSVVRRVAVVVDAVDAYHSDVLAHWTRAASELTASARAFPTSTRPIVVFLALDAFAESLTALRATTRRVPLYAPSPTAIVRILRDAHPHFDAAALTRVAEQCGGDLRTARTSVSLLAHKFKDGEAHLCDDKDRHTHLFDDTRALLHGTLPPWQWADRARDAAGGGNNAVGVGGDETAGCTGPHTQLLFHNHLALFDDDVDALCERAETLSTVDVCRSSFVLDTVPLRFTQRPPIDPKVALRFPKNAQLRPRRSADRSRHRSSSDALWCPRTLEGAGK
jgi:hypothetical protein